MNPFGVTSTTHLDLARIGVWNRENAAAVAFNRDRPARELRQESDMRGHETRLKRYGVAK